MLCDYITTLYIVQLGSIRQRRNKEMPLVRILCPFIHWVANIPWNCHYKKTVALKFIDLSTGVNSNGVGDALHELHIISFFIVASATDRHHDCWLILSLLILFCPQEYLLLWGRTQAIPPCLGSIMKKCRNKILHKTAPSAAGDNIEPFVTHKGSHFVWLHLKSYGFDAVGNFHPPIWNQLSAIEVLNPLHHSAGQSHHQGNCRAC